MARLNDVAMYLVYLRDMDEECSKYYGLSTLKLQKLIYYACGGHYMKWDERLIADRDDPFEAGRYGPYISELDGKFGVNVLFDIQEGSAYGDYGYLYFVDVLSDEERFTIERVWGYLKNRDAFELVESFSEDLPYRMAYGSDTRVMTDETIRAYFRSSVG